MKWGRSDVDSPTESSDGAVSEPQPLTSSVVSVSKLSGLGWLIRVGVNSAAVLTVVALILVLIGVAQRTGWVTAGGFGGESANTTGKATVANPNATSVP